MAWNGVSVDPILVPENDRWSGQMLQADWMAGVWEGSQVVFFDNWIFDTDTPCYVPANLSWEAIANHATSIKRAKYGSPTEELWASFTLLVCSSAGVLHREYTAFQKRMACRLASKWQKPFSGIMAWVHVRTQFAIIHFVDLHLCGMCQWISGLGVHNGAAIRVGY